MDISPAPPSTSIFAFNPVSTSNASSNSLSRPPSASSTSKPFDNSFFAKLAANQPGSAGSGLHRSRTRSAEVQALAIKDGNEQTIVPSFPLKRPAGLLRTASAAAKSNPFEVSPRFPGPGTNAPLTRPGLLERARSDGGLVFGAAGQGAAPARPSLGRAPSALGREVGPAVARPAPNPYPLQSGSGRRISGRYMSGVGPATDSRLTGLPTALVSEVRCRQSGQAVSLKFRQPNRNLPDCATQ